MKRLKKELKISLIFIVILAGAIPVQTQAKPGIKIIKTVHGCKRFLKERVHPNRYIVSTSQSRPYSPVIYDIQKNKTISLPSIDKIPGLPVAIKIPRGSRNRYKRNGLTLAGKNWRWYDKKIVYYNEEKGVAGIFLDQKKKRKIVQGNPPCPDGSSSRLVAKYNMYLCDSTRKYVKEKVYIGSVHVQYYAELDLKSRQIRSMTPLERNWNDPNEQEGVQPIGVDPEGKYFYYFNKVFFYKKKQTPGHILLHRFNIEEKKVDWKYTVPVPVRYKGKTAPTYGISAMFSDDFSKIFFREYDQGMDYKPSVGWLKNPTARGYIVDTLKKSHITIGIPVTAYGQCFDRENKYLIVGSNQTGNLHRYDLATGKETRKIKSMKSIFKIILSPNSRYLYIFTKYGVEVRSWPTLKKVRTIPLRKIFPGITKLLVGETINVTADGKFAVIGILKKGKRGPWASSDRDDGFYLLSIGD
ncbi:MAG: hypothetical protein GY754_07880 [bacterium]|nr:hypothetical protein [bacterium]